MPIPSTPYCDNCHNGNSCSSNNTGGCSGCNTCNSTCQTLCQVGYQLVTKHPSIRAFPWREVQKNESISLFITAENWNTLISELNKAEQIGDSVKQGSAGIANPVKVNDIITAQCYNEIRTKLSGFVDGNYDAVQKNDLITAARFNAIRNSYNQAKFKTSVCDACNSGLNRCACNCSCSCSCACPCPCSCQSPCNSPSGD